MPYVKTAFLIAVAFLSVLGLATVTGNISDRFTRWQRQRSSQQPTYHSIGFLLSSAPLQPDDVVFTPIDDEGLLHFTVEHDNVVAYLFWWGSGTQQEHFADPTGGRSYSRNMSDTIHHERFSRDPVHGFYSVEGTAYVPLVGAPSLRLYMIHRCNDSDALSISELFMLIGGGRANGGFGFGSTAFIMLRHRPVTERITLIQLDSDHNTLFISEHAPGAMPESFTPYSETAYFIVESHSANAVTRQVLGRGDRYFVTHFLRPSNLLAQQRTNIVWPPSLLLRNNSW